MMHWSKYMLVFLAIGFMLGCSKEDNRPPSPPGKALLVFPLENSECTTGQSISETTSQVEFRWQASENTDFYDLEVSDLTTNELQKLRTSSSSARVVLEKGTPYSWTVTSLNSESDQTIISDRWLFYNAGAQTNYAPFPAVLIAPGSGRTVAADTNGQIALSWSGNDIENDIENYQVYFSAENPPLLFVTTDVAITQINVDVNSDTVYYWKVVTVDALGNTSDSGVNDFRVGG